MQAEFYPFASRWQVAAPTALTPDSANLPKNQAVATDFGFTAPHFAQPSASNAKGTPRRNDPRLEIFRYPPRPLNPTGGLRGLRRSGAGSHAPRSSSPTRVASEACTLP